MSKFKPGDTVIFDSNSKCLDGLSEAQRIQYYGSIGYGRTKPLFFTFLCYHRPQVGHCVLINMDTRQIEIMRHPNDFRLVTDDEC